MRRKEPRQREWEKRRRITEKWRRERNGEERKRRRRTFKESVIKCNG